jgi:hypothetical protein
VAGNVAVVGLSLRRLDMSIFGTEDLQECGLSASDLEKELSRPLLTRFDECVDSRNVSSSSGKVDLVVMLYRWTRSTKNLHASLLSSVEVDFTFRS